MSHDRDKSHDSKMVDLKKNIIVYRRVRRQYRDQTCFSVHLHSLGSEGAVENRHRPRNPANFNAR